ncbi:Hypothetical predicted protein [Mytilus galloprovincialis]|uniref:Fibrinogen C-terminal domain-containing protein n=1 Tax=Mytilus galloprovincialis TaxID=29158 RepID=A0A8B6BIP3_MYTGA|nr:Hypothetical predicted protein [Mytilus galloprovincialis]
MLNVPRLIFTCILLADFVVTNLNKRVKAGKRNRSFDNIYKTGNVLRELKITNAFSCLALCADHIDCRSVAYNSNDGRCHEFNRDFTNQHVAGIYQVGWIHFDVSKGSACKDSPPTARDCDDVQSQGYTCSGVYSITLVPGRSVNVLCDLQTAGGRWTVFQHRKDGSVNFDMNWFSYKYGFGDAYTEVWLGDSLMHMMPFTSPQGGQQFSTRDSDNDG